MMLNMYFPSSEDRAEDIHVIDSGIEQAVFLANLGYHVWTTDHHFRGPYHSNPMQYMAYLAPLLPKTTYLGFGLLSIPLYHPLRLVESMNLLDHLTKGRCLFGIGSGWQGTEPDALGVDKEYHASGRAAEDTLNVMEKLWGFKNGDAPYAFEVGTNKGLIKRRVTPGPYSNHGPTMIRVATREAGLIRAAQNGWPAFLGALGADLDAQSRLYRKTLGEANLPQEVVENCIRWCSKDWLAVVVAPTDKEAKEMEREANAEQLQIRRSFIDRHGKIDGPVIKPKPGQSIADAYATGGDLTFSIVGSPDTVAAQVQKVLGEGINHILVRFVGEWAGKTRHVCESSAKLFAKEVLPRFKDKHVSPDLRARELA